VPLHKPLILEISMCSKLGPYVKPRVTSVNNLREDLGMVSLFQSFGNRRSRGDSQWKS
jgi:hypothetical protein